MKIFAKEVMEEVKMEQGEGEPTREKKVMKKMRAVLSAIEVREVEV